MSFPAKGFGDSAPVNFVHPSYLPMYNSNSKIKLNLCEDHPHPPTLIIHSVFFKSIQEIQSDKFVQNSLGRIIYTLYNKHAMNVTDNVSPLK